MWKYAAYDVYNDIWSHTGDVMEIGWGTIHKKPSKQKPNKTNINIVLTNWPEGLLTVQYLVIYILKY